MVWLSGYTYRKKGAVNATTAGAQTNYQLELIVGESSGASGVDVHCENHCLDFPNDIRFTKEDGETKHDYWVDAGSLEGTTPNRKVSVWIEVASIPASSSVDFYMYYCKSSDSGESSGDNTFEFFDDFEKLSKDYFTDQGYHPFYSNISKNGIYHNNKTYIAFQGDSHDPYALYYNHTTEEWSTPVKVGTNPLSEPDNHGVPSLLRDSAGYWHIFYGCHNGYVQHAKSTNIDDVSTWTDKGNIGSTASTYPCSVLASNGDIYLFYRKKISSTDYPECYIKSTDNGENWAAEVKIIDFSSVSNRIYMSNFELEAGTPERIHMSWSYSNGPNDWRRNVYHAYLVITGADTGKLFGMGGSNLGATITKSEADSHCLVYNSGTTYSALPRCHLFGGIPYILFPLAGTPATYQFTKWNGSSWDTPASIGVTAHDPLLGSSTPDFIVHSASNIEAYILTPYGGASGGNIERWDWNGSSWSKNKTVLAAFECSGLNYPWIIKNFNTSLRLLFATQNGRKTYAYGDDFVQNKLDLLDEDKWSEEATPSVSIGSSVLTLGADAANEDIKSKTFTANGYSSSIAVRTKLKLSGSIPADFGFGQYTGGTIYEDFTTFTEVDVAADRIQKTANHIDHLAYRNETTYLYKDYGVDHFGDFTHKIKCRVTSLDDTGFSASWVLANDLGDMGALDTGNKTAIMMRFYRSGTSYRLGLYELYTSNWYGDNYQTTSALLNTWYYVKIVKSGTSLTAYIYSDADYSVLVDTVSTTLHANHAFRYLYGCSTRNTGSTPTATQDTENFDIGENVPTTHCALLKYHSADNYCLAAEDGSNQEISAGITIETADYHIREIVWTSAHVKLFKDDVEQKSLNSYHPNASLPIKLGNPEDTTGGTRTGYYDWVLSRKYASPEPTWGSWGSQEQEKAFIVDAILVYKKTKTFTADAIIKGPITKTFSTDAVLKKTSEKTYVADVILINQVTKTFTVDAQTASIKTFTCDSILVNQATKSFITDVILSGKISGITRDSGGFILGNCTIWLFKTSDKSFVEETASNANGEYSFDGLLAGIDYFIRAFKDGSPNVFGTTDDDLEAN